jgi:hypothetical protein
VVVSSSRLALWIRVNRRVAPLMPSSADFRRAGGAPTAAPPRHALAVDTGGFMVKNSNDLGQGLGRILRDNEAYYLLAYEPTNTALLNQQNTLLSIPAEQAGASRMPYTHLRSSSALRIASRSRRVAMV